MLTLQMLLRLCGQGDELLGVVAVIDDITGHNHLVLGVHRTLHVIPGGGPFIRLFREESGLLISRRDLRLVGGLQGVQKPLALPLPVLQRRQFLPELLIIMGRLQLLRIVPIEGLQIGGHIRLQAIEQRLEALLRGETRP
jgi:hypothetical protein